METTVETDVNSGGRLSFSLCFDPGEDPHLKGVISLSSWKRICKSTTKLAIDWILLARLVGGASINNIRYMETLNRFGFKIASQAGAYWSSKYAIVEC